VILDGLIYFVEANQLQRVKIIYRVK